MRLDSIEILKVVAFGLKYVGTVITLNLAWITLHRKTVEDDPSGQVRKLTKDGRKYRRWLIISTVITLLSAAGNDYLDNRLKKDAERRGNEQVSNALKAQYEKYISALSQELETKVTPEINAQTNRLGAATRKLSEEIASSERKGSLSNVEVDPIAIRMKFGLPRNVSTQHAGSGLDHKLPSAIERVCGVAFLSQAMDNHLSDVDAIAQNLRLLSPSPECRKTVFHYDTVYAATDAANSLDPAAHLDFGINFVFSGFNILSSLVQCETDSAMTTTSAPCLTFRVSSRARLPDPTQLTYTEASAYLFARLLNDVEAGELPSQAHLNLELFGEPELWRSVFGGTCIRGRDMDLSFVTGWVCDGHASEPVEDRKKHLNEFLKMKVLQIDIDASEQQARKPLWHQQALSERDRKTDRPTMSNSTGPLALCSGFIYNVPRQALR